MTYYSSGCYRNNNFVDSNGRSGKSTKGSFLGLEEVSSSVGVRMRMPPPLTQVFQTLSSVGGTIRIRLETVTLGRL